MYVCMYVCTRESSWNPNYNTLELDQLQHDRSAAYIVAQQYSPPSSRRGALSPARKNSELI
jgi:hypothetical protein